MQEHELENFLEEYPEVIEEGLQIIERQKNIGTGIIDLLCKDANKRYVVIEIKVDPSPQAVAQVVKYVLALQRQGIPRENIRGILVTRYIDQETQDLCTYFNIEAKGLALGKPKEAYFKSIGVDPLNQQNNQLKFVPSPTPRTYDTPYGEISRAESNILKAIIGHNKQKQSPSYADISKTVNLSMSCIRGHISAIIFKGIPLVKKKAINGTIYINLMPEDLKNLSSVGNKDEF